MTYSNDLLRRASLVVPGGVWGHNRFPAALDPGRYPWFAERGEGARLRDADGRWYNDFLCGYGSMVVGYADKRVNAAALAEQERGDTLTLATARSVELAERLVGLVSGTAWACWGKSGSDSTWTAVLIARAHTGRPLIACVDGAYHGSHSWCGWCNGLQGRHPSESRLVRTLRWNDLDALDALFHAVGDKLAAVMITPFHHPIPGRAELPDPAWLAALRTHCDRYGTVLISDDVRAGFRLDIRGSHAHVGFCPDLVCFSKALANGWPIAAVLGSAALRPAADELFLAGTFWNAGSSMAAALATLDVLEADDSIARMRVAGTAFASGLLELAARHDVPLEVTGPPAIPTVTVAGDDDFTWMRSFAAAMAARGTLVHPMHNWFISAAHDDEVIGQSLEHASIAIQRAQDECGSLSGQSCS